MSACALALLLESGCLSNFSLFGPHFCDNRHLFSSIRWNISRDDTPESIRAKLLKLTPLGTSRDKVYALLKRGVGRDGLDASEDDVIWAKLWSLDHGPFTPVHYTTAFYFFDPSHALVELRIEDWVERW